MDDIDVRQRILSNIAVHNSSFTLKETQELHSTIKTQIEASNKQSKVISRLTIFMAILAFIQSIATIIQVVQIYRAPQSACTGNILSNSAENLKKR